MGLEAPDDRRLVEHVAQPLQDLTGPEAAHIGDNGGKLAVGVLLHGLQPVGEPGPRVDQVDTVAGQGA